MSDDDLKWNDFSNVYFGYGLSAREKLRKPWLPYLPPISSPTDASKHDWVTEIDWVPDPLIEFDKKLREENPTLEDAWQKYLTIRKML